MFNIPSTVKIIWGHCANLFIHLAKAASEFMLMSYQQLIYHIGMVRNSLPAHSDFCRLGLALKNFKMAAIISGHLGYLKGTILTILNLHVALMSLTKLQFNLIYSSEGDVI